MYVYIHVITFIIITTYEYDESVGGSGDGGSGGAYFYIGDDIFCPILTGELRGVCTINTFVGL